MLVTRVVAGLTAVITAALGLSVATAGPAAAATGNWSAYGNTNPITSSSSTWRCGTTYSIDTDVVAQACAIRSSSGSSVQGAVIVRNNRGNVYGTDAVVELSASSGSYLGAWVCPSSLLYVGWTVCFGQTISRSGQVFTLGQANGEYLGVSPSV
jgi:hypothetical protein